MEMLFIGDLRRNFLYLDGVRNSLWTSRMYRSVAQNCQIHQPQHLSINIPTTPSTLKRQKDHETTQISPPHLTISHHMCLLFGRASLDLRPRTGPAAEGENGQEKSILKAETFGGTTVLGPDNQELLGRPSGALEELRRRRTHGSRADQGGQKAQVRAVAGEIHMGVTVI